MRILSNPVTKWDCLDTLDVPSPIFAVQIKMQKQYRDFFPPHVVNHQYETRDI